MHTYQGETHSFHFNSDFSGNIIIHNNSDSTEVVIPAEEILKLVAYRYVLPNKIRELEQMDAKSLLSE